MLKRSIISVSELYENVPTVGDATRIVICDENHLELVRGFWWDEQIQKYLDMVVEEFRYNAVHDALLIYLLNYNEPDTTAAY